MTRRDRNRRASSPGRGPPRAPEPRQSHGRNSEANPQEAHRSLSASVARGMKTCCRRKPLDGSMIGARVLAAYWNEKAREREAIAAALVCLALSALWTHAGSVLNVEGIDARGRRQSRPRRAIPRHQRRGQGSHDREPAGYFSRYEEEGTGRRFQERGPRLAQARRSRGSACTIS